MVIHNIAAAPEKFCCNISRSRLPGCVQPASALDVLWKAGSTAKLVVQMSE
jgi:hypothetical protein